MQQSIIKKIYKNNRGYTIVEMFVSITIIGIISGVFFMNYKSADKQFLLDQATQQVASDLRQVQNYALGQKEYDGALPEGGWGIQFRKQNPFNEYYFLFADVLSASEYQCDDSNTCAGEIYGNGNKKGIYLPTPITISDIIVTDGTGDHSVIKGTVTFIAPDASVEICNHTGSCVDFYQIQIIVDDDPSNATGKTKTITINKYGLIDID